MIFYRMKVFAFLGSFAVVGEVFLFHSSEIPYDTCIVEDGKFHVMTFVQLSLRRLV